ncbi:MAG: hypothetical protein HOQ05_08240 [Corynebacteriales bacterium]|nr:hypothetical protein [Mycobacteriales bacterium]
MRRIRNAFALTLALALAIPTTSAQAAPAETNQAAAAPATVTADPMSTWQTNGIVWTMETIDNVVYIGGNFTKVRPPGAKKGENEVDRKNLAAFDANTGELLPFSHNFTAPVYVFDADNDKVDPSCTIDWDAETYTCDTVYEIRRSPDNQRIVVGGDFVWVDGKDRRKLATFTVANARTANAGLTSFRVTGTDRRVRSLAVTDSTIYFGGIFANVAGQPRSQLAAVDATSGALKPWAPNAQGRTANGGVLAMVVAPDKSRIIIGGEFDKVAGRNIHGLAALDPNTGETTRWDSAVIPSASYVTDLVVDQDTVYGGADGRATFDGRFAADPYTGKMRWVDNCAGATWSVAILRDVLYSGSHAHNCSSTPGGFPETNYGQENPQWYRLLAQKAREPETEILHWFPNTNGGDFSVPATHTPARLGPRCMVVVGDQLWVGGQFTTVNNKQQQSLTRFTFGADTGAPTAPSEVKAEVLSAAQRNAAPSSPAPSPSPEITPSPQPTPSQSPSPRPSPSAEPSPTPSPSGSSSPRIVPQAYTETTATGRVRIKWTSSYDLDDAVITYRIYRNGEHVGTVERTEKPWAPGSVEWIDEAAPSGATYTVSASDPDGNTSKRITATT